MNILWKIKKCLGKNRIVFLSWQIRMYYKRFFPDKECFGACGSNTIIEYPVFFDTPENVYVDEDVKIRSTARFINSPNEKITIKKYTSIGPNCTIITNNHHKTVGIPHFLGGAAHINDKCADVTIEEDVWIGSCVIILPGVTVGRGSIIGAGTIVTKSMPPYSVVVGSPARIMGKVFDKEDIIRHEQVLYPPSKRMSTQSIDLIFSEYHYSDMRSFGCNQKTTVYQCREIELMKHRLHFIGYNE